MKRLLLKTTYSLLLCMFFTFYTFSTFESHQSEIEHYQKANSDKKTLADYQAINEDIMLVLRFSDREIPVVQSRDNQDYVRMNIWKEKDMMGSAMIDYQASDENVIIHAHSSTRNNEMFTPFKNHDYVIENTEFEIENKQGHERYQIISYMRLDIEREEDLFFLETTWRNSEEMNRHIKSMVRLSMLAFPLSIEYVSKLVTLVTCDANQDHYRYVIIATPLEGAVYESS